MSLLQETCDAITGRSHEIEQHIIDSWNAGSPVGQYGRLVNVVAQYGAATNQVHLTVPKPCMIIASADHGVADMGVSAYPKETTVGMTQNYLIPKGAGANSLANYCGAQMEVIDMGVDADMGADAFAERQRRRHDSPASVRCDPVDRAVRGAAQPGAVNLSIAGVLPQQERKYPVYLPVRTDSVQNPVLNILPERLLRGMILSPLVGVSGACHKGSGRSINGADVVKVLKRNLSNFVVHKIT
mgnify:CR=1 FL=1